MMSRCEHCGYDLSGAESVLCPECGTHVNLELSSLSGATRYVPEVPTIAHNFGAARYVVQGPPAQRGGNDVMRVFAPAWPGLSYWCAIGGIFGVIFTVGFLVAPAIPPKDRPLMIGLGSVAVVLGLIGMVVLPLASQWLRHVEGDLLRIEGGHVHLPRHKVVLAASDIVRVELVAYAATSENGAHTSHLSDLVLCAKGSNGVEVFYELLTEANGPKRTIGEAVARALGVPFARTHAGTFRYGERKQRAQ